MSAKEVWKVVATNGDQTRPEVIYQGNVLFEDCVTRYQVKRRYEDLWGSEQPKVKVVSVERL